MCQRNMATAASGVRRMSDIPEWLVRLQATAFCGTAVSALAAAIQLVRLGRQQRRDSHRQRMQMALQLLKDWDEKFTPESRRFFDIAYLLATSDSSRHVDQLKAMWQSREFVVPLSIVREISNPNADKPETYDRDQATKMRFAVIAILNALERICISFTNKIVDRGVLIAAFGSSFLSQTYLEKCKSIIRVFQGADVMTSDGQSSVTDDPYWSGITKFDRTAK